jgi:hypothetical protein
MALRITSLLLISCSLCLGQVSPPFFYVDKSGSSFSYDTAESYSDGTNLNGLNGGVLGTVDPWAGAYVSRANAFGILANDTMEQYSDGTAVNGLNMGDGFAGAYVDRQNLFPGVTYDTMESYSDGASLAGLNGGANNGSTTGVAWNGFYVVGPPTLSIVISPSSGTSGFDAPPPQTVTITVSGGMPSAVYYTTNGTLPTTSSTLYSAPFSVSVDPTTVRVLAVDSVTGNEPTYATTNYTSCGVTWSNNVVVNGGAGPSANSINALNTFWAGLITDGLQNSIISGIAVSTDSLIAATTPFVYRAGSNPWANHNFVSGDLTINGLTGDGSTKYLATGIIPSTCGVTTTDAGMVIYAYNTNTAATGVEFDCYDGGSVNWALVGNYNSGGLGTFYDNSFQNRVSAAAVGSGFLAGMRTSSSAIAIYYAKAGTFTTVASTGGATAGVLNAVALTAFSGNTLGSPAQYVNATLSFIAATRGLNINQTSNLFLRVQTFRTSEGGGFR